LLVMGEKNLEGEGRGGREFWEKSDGASNHKAVQGKTGGSVIWTR